jgi:DNA mismatch endonuclease (patch repair protein)
MSSVRSKHTDIELAVRRAAHGLGYRFRLHPDLPGRPDLVFPRLKIAVFVHGCFWHGHNCRKGALPATNAAFWEAKVEANKERDQRASTALEKLGWSVQVVWGCEAKPGHNLSELLQAALTCGTDQKRAMAQDGG